MESFNLLLYLDGPAHGWPMLKDVAVTVSPEEADIFYSLSNADNLCGYIPGILDQYYTLVYCISAKYGRFVQLQHFNPNKPLMLYEVEVWGV